MDYGRKFVLGMYATATGVALWFMAHAYLFLSANVGA